MEPVTAVQETIKEVKSANTRAKELVEEKGWFGSIIHSLLHALVKTISSRTMWTVFLIHVEFWITLHLIMTKQLTLTPSIEHLIWVLNLVTLILLGLIQFNKVDTNINLGVNK